MQRKTFHPGSAFCKDLSQVRAVLMADALALQYPYKNLKGRNSFHVKQGVWSSCMPVVGNWAVREESCFCYLTWLVLLFLWTVRKVVLCIKSSAWLNFQAWQCGSGFSVAMSGDNEGCLLRDRRWGQCRGRWELRPDQEVAGCGEAHLVHEKARDSDSSVLAQQVCSDEVGLRPSQEAHLAGLSQDLSQDWRDRGQVWM